VLFQGKTDAQSMCFFASASSYLHGPKVTGEPVVARSPRPQRTPISSTGGGEAPAPAPACLLVCFAFGVIQKEARVTPSCSCVLVRACVVKASGGQTLDAVGRSVKVVKYFKRRLSGFATVKQCQECCRSDKISNMDTQIHIYLQHASADTRQ
jgi:hypothetical protein